MSNTKKDPAQELVSDLLEGRRLAIEQTKAQHATKLKQSEQSKCEAEFSLWLLGFQSRNEDREVTNQFDLNGELTKAREALKATNALKAKPLEAANGVSASPTD